MNDLIIIVNGLCMSFGSLIAKLKTGILLTNDIVNKVIMRNATSGCSVLGHNTRFFEISVLYACYKPWNTLPPEIRNYVESKVNVSIKLNEWIINELENIYTT
jgi:hypothetical protein